MPEIALTVSMLKAVATVLILLGAIYGFVSEKVPPDVVSLLIILALLLTGVLGPGDAFSGFSHPATVSVAAVLVLSSAIERTGVLSVLARRVLAPLGRSEILFTAVIMLVIAMLSAFVNNTAAVAIFIPVVLEVCRRTGASPGRVLMPMSHAATFGGMCTLMGTSTNLVAHEFARNQGLPGFSMFEIGKIGVPMLLVGFAYILLVGRWFLPRNQVAMPETIGQADPYLSELLVLDNSRRVIHCACEARLTRCWRWRRVMDWNCIALRNTEPKTAPPQRLYRREQTNQMLKKANQSPQLRSPMKKRRASCNWPKSSCSLLRD